MSNTPSRRDGVSLELENRSRYDCATFLSTMGQDVNLPITMDMCFAAITFCHRFFLIESYARHDHEVISTACMLLASKSRDILVELKDDGVQLPKVTVDQLVKTMLSIVDAEADVKQPPLNKEDEERREDAEREKVLDAEILVLRTLNFNVGFSMPYDILKKFTKKLKEDHPEVKDPFFDAIEELKNGYLTCLCLRFNAKEIAAAGLSIAGETKNFNLPNNWYEFFDVTPHRLEEICREMKQELEWIKTDPECFSKFVCCETWVDP